MEALLNNTPTAAIVARANALFDDLSFADIAGALIAVLVPIEHQLHVVLLQDGHNEIAGLLCQRIGLIQSGGVRRLMPVSHTPEGLVPGEVFIQPLQHPLKRGTQRGIATHRRAVRRAVQVGVESHEVYVAPVE